MRDTHSQNTQGAIAPWEQMAAVTILAAAFALRVIWCLYADFDSDEAQHLHVVWGWANGLLPYRDLFDNHTPLFHLLCVPGYLLFGERPDLLILMRFLMFPLYGAALWLTYRIGRSLYTARIGLWSMVIVSVFPLFFSNSLEFRPDNLWMVLWMAAVMLLLTSKYTWKRYLLIGLLLGAAAGTSQKTVIMLMALVSAGVIMLLISRSKHGLKKQLLRVVPILAGFLVVACTIAGYFIAQRAWRPFIYGVLWHNIVPGLHTWSKLKLYVILPAGLMLMYLAAKYVYRQDLLEAKKSRVMLFLAVGLYLLYLLTTMPAVYKQSYLPVEPLGIIVLVGLAGSALCGLGKYRTRINTIQAGWGIVLVVILLEGIVLGIETPRENETRADIERVADVLRLTDPGDTVMDYKGELIFRRRGYYYVLEKLTRTRLRRGLLENTIAKSLIESRTCVATSTRGFGEEFLADNYIWVGSLRVAGKFLFPEADKTVSFEIAIPARYCLVTQQGPAGGTLDGQRYTRPAYLQAGRHEYQRSNGELDVALIWAQAIERGFDPLGSEAKQRTK